MRKALLHLALFAGSAHAAAPGVVEVPCDEYNQFARKPVNCSFTPVVKLDERRWAAIKADKMQSDCIAAVVAAEGVPPWMVKNGDGSQHCKK